MLTHIAMEMSRAQGKKVWESWKLGDRVQHIGTKVWGVIISIVPQSDGTCEMLVKTDPPHHNAYDAEPHGWASYHIRDHEPKRVLPKDPTAS